MKARVSWVLVALLSFAGAGAMAFPLLASAQAQSIRADEQIILSQIMTAKRAAYVQAMQLTDEESRAFWPIYDEHEARVKKIDGQVIQLANDYAAKYSTMTDADARQISPQR